MGRDLIKLVLLAGLVGLAVLYGMELASDGIAGVYGPLDDRDRALYRQTENTWRTVRNLPERPPDRRAALDTEEYRDDGADASDAGDAWERTAWEGRRPFVDKIAGEAAEALSRLSREGIRTLVTVVSRATEWPEAVRDGGEPPR
ncbi:MAG: hypothetical protein BAA02_13685 [Paenibacillaceae bacterium ZCTH02-B3]|nr:MAG: hypothetical protein BAA02_13685 [Paenibacillaceae bacterium ZCTH02-B3]